MSCPVLARDVEGMTHGIITGQLAADCVFAEAAEGAMRETLDVAIGGTSIGEAPGTLPLARIEAGIVHPSGIGTDAPGTSAIGEKATFDRPADVAPARLVRLIFHRPPAQRATE